MIPETDYEVVVQPNDRWFYIDWKGLLHYRDLLWFLVRRDFISKYKQTILGPAWCVLQPILTTLVFTIVFGKAVRISTNGLPPFLFYLSGLLFWSYFAQSVSSISLSLLTNAHILSKVYFPRLVLPLSMLLSSLIAFTIQLSTFLIFYLSYRLFWPHLYSFHTTAWLWTLPLFLLQTALLSLGVGLWIAALTVRYRDFQHLLSILIQLWMFATPIIYPISIISERWRFLMALNPMAAIVESTRHAFFGTGAISVFHVCISITFSLVAVIGGLLFFNKVQRTFVDVI